jgi:nucleotide-binding universal stress UspA family protein
MRASAEESPMLKLLLPVDGSEASARATAELIRMLPWYKEQPAIELLAVHPPVPRLPNMKVVVSEEAIEKYYAEETDAMIAPSTKMLDAAGVTYSVQKLVGPIAESIVDHAKHIGADMIVMGTRGMTALSNMVMGSVATRVLHLAHVPVVLIH